MTSNTSQNVNQTPVDLWDLLTFDRKLSKESEPQNKKSDTRLGSLKFQAMVGDLAGSLLWLYALIQTFVFNIDSTVKSHLPQNLAPIVDYKIVLFVAILVIILIFLHKYLLIPLYILFFPLILIFWKFPKFIYKFKSWIVVISVIDILVGYLNHLRNKLLILCSGILTIVFATTDSSILLSVSMLLSGAVIIYLIQSTVRNSFKPNRFISAQTKAVDSIVNSNFIKGQTLIDKKIKNRRNKLTVEQSNKFLGNAQFAVILHQALYFWAYQLEKYTESRARIILSWLSYASLVIKIVFFLSIINFVLYKLYPLSFRTHQDINFIVFIYYSITSLWFSEVASLQAVSTYAILIRILSGIVGVGILGSFILSIALRKRNESEQEGLLRTIASIKKAGKEFEDIVAKEYSTSSIDDLFDRLKSLRLGLVDFIMKLTEQLPKDYK